MKSSRFGVASSRILLVAFLGASLFACSKSETESEAVKPTENNIAKYVEANAGTLESKTRSSGPWELGVVFSTAAAGKLTQVGTRMPESGSYRVIVWDFDAKTVLRQKTVEQTTPDQLTLADVDALALTPNKKYVISVNSQSGGINKKYFFAAKTGGGDWLPFTKGSVLVHSVGYTLSAAAKFPNEVKDVKYELYGYPEFTFVAE